MTSIDEICSQIERIASGGGGSEELRRELAALIVRLRANPAESSPPTQIVDPEEMLRRLKEMNLPPAGLFNKVRADNLLAQDPRVVGGVARMLIQDGEYVLAYDLVQSARQQYPDDVLLRQVQALTLARSGATAMAAEILEDVRDDGIQDAVTFALLGGIQRDLGIRASAEHPREAERFFRKARSFYLRAYQKDPCDWFLARLAIMTLLSNEKDAKDAAYKSANTLLDKCAERIKTAERSDLFWPLAHTGEAHLILGNESDARRAYATAAQHIGRRFGDLASARRHAKILIEHHGMAWDESDPLLRMPPIVVFVGHMVDPEDGSHQANPRFPADHLLEQSVRREIATRLQGYGAKLGFASAACGSDILFHEVLQHEMDGESNVVLPCHPNLFVKYSVLPGGNSWLGRFKGVLDDARLVLLGDQLFDYDGLSFIYGNMVLSGLAASRARDLGAEIKYLAVWDGQTGRGPGGTADHIKRWRDRGHAVDVIDLTLLRKKYYKSSSVIGAPPVLATAAPSVPTITGNGIKFEAKIVGVLFSDVAGFSKLNEKQLLVFVELFLGEVANLLRESKLEPLKKNTWGDGLYFVFDDIRATGKFALDLSDRVAQKRTDWAARGLPPDLDLRTAVHAGPVFSISQDPVTELPNCMGMHVSKTARIEPITPKGQVYASQEFAAIAETEGIEEFECNYVGQTEFAKKYGTFPIYHLRRRA